MLVLSRGIGERIRIGTPPDEIVIMPTRISGKEVRLGIDAPRSLNIRREELGPKLTIRQPPEPAAEQKPETPAGVCFWDPHNGYWPSTFVAGVGPQSKAECMAAAYVAAPRLQDTDPGEIRTVTFQEVNEDAKG